MYYLFEGKKWLSFPVGIIWALLVTNMYLLLLHTVAPSLLPVKKKKLLDDKSILSASMLFRVSFMSLLAIIIAQPLNVLFLSPFAEKSLKNYKAEYEVNMMIVADSALIKSEQQYKDEFNQVINSKLMPIEAKAVEQGIQALHIKISEDSSFLTKSKLLLDSLIKWNGKFSDKWQHISDSTRTILCKMLVEELESDRLFLLQIDSWKLSNNKLLHDYINYKGAIKKIMIAKSENYETLKKLIAKSNFYVKKNQIILSENPFSWLITLSIVTVFLFPIYLKYSIRNNGNFYLKKKKEEDELICNSYDYFKKNYKTIFKEKIESYNSRTLNNLNPFLNKLSNIVPNKHEELTKEITNTLADEVDKFEYWADHPYRTIRKTKQSNLATEEELLKLIYPSKK
jgi:hypothetical protein